VANFTLPKAAKCDGPSATITFGAKGRDLPSTIPLPRFVNKRDRHEMNNADNLTSLREAIAFAYSNPGTNTITFGNGSGSAGRTSSMRARHNHADWRRIIAGVCLTVAGPGCGKNARVCRA
jgi:hypothetical protein